MQEFRSLFVYFVTLFDIHAWDIKDSPITLFCDTIWLPISIAPIVLGKRLLLHYVHSHAMESSNAQAPTRRFLSSYVYERLKCK